MLVLDAVQKALILKTRGGETKLHLQPSTAGSFSFFFFLCSCSRSPTTVKASRRGTVILILKALRVSGPVKLAAVADACHPAAM